MLPTDARRRIVLVSDGRATAGDVSDESSELEAAGIPVDVVTLETTGGPDAAVAGIDVPDLARPDDVVPVIVHVQASEATDGHGAAAPRRRGGRPADRRARAGRQRGALRATTPGADAGAVMRYQATVTAPRDAVAENDVGFAAVPVEGPARVLVVEGTAARPTTLVAALNAGGRRHRGRSASATSPTCRSSSTLRRHRAGRRRRPHAHRRPGRPTSPPPSATSAAGSSRSAASAATASAATRSRR